MSGGQQNLRDLFRIGLRGRRDSQYHTSDRIRQRPVDELFGDERFVRHNDLFAVPVADGGGAGIYFRHATGQAADSDRIADTDRFLKQDDQAGDKVGENFL